MVITLKKSAHSRKKIALAIFAALITLAALLFGLRFGGAIREAWGLYKEAVPNDEAVYTKVESVRSSGDYTALDDISEAFKKELLHQEDRRFYYHPGVDPIGVVRALFANIKSGKIVQGASTITMQLARNLFFSQERTTVRKAAEVFAAFKLETLLEKDEILELYCNASYFGEGCYGISAAARYYYGVEASELDEEQSAVLVYTLRAPSVYHPEPFVSEAA